MENYKKDQDVYMIGESPNKFYMILTGQVDGDWRDEAPPWRVDFREGRREELNRPADWAKVAEYQ